jgi:hypothetical protein
MDQQDQKTAPVAEPAAPAAAAAAADQKTPPTPDSAATPPPSAEDAAALRARLDKSVSAEKNLRDRLRKLESEQEEREKKAAEEQGKWRELYEKASPKVKAADEYEAIIREMIDSETSTLAPEQKAVIDALPDGVRVGQKLKLARSMAAANAAAAARAPAAPQRTPAPPATAPRPAGSDGGAQRVWSEREFEALSYADREKFMPEFLAAVREGRLGT